MISATLKCHRIGSKTLLKTRRAAAVLRQLIVHVHLAIRLAQHGPDVVEEDEAHDRADGDRGELTRPVGVAARGSANRATSARLVTGRRARWNARGAWRQ